MEFLDALSPERAFLRSDIRDGRLFSYRLLRSTRLNTVDRMPGKISPKIIILSLFEPTGGMSGEQKLFTDRLGFTKTYEIPGCFGDLFLNPDGVGALVIGIGATKPAISLMALGYDDRFDLRKTYFLIAGIAGVDPLVGSLASVAWVRFAVDGNLAFEIDVREMPADWPTGIFPLGSNKPYEMPYRGDDGVFLKDEVIELNDGLKNWGYELTKSLPLQDNDAMQENRRAYTGHPLGQKPPFVFPGDVLACERFWHGGIYTEWARRWVQMWTEGRGTFAMTNTDDMGALRGLKALDTMGKADFSRVMLIRSGSNYCLPPPGVTPIENLASEGSEEDRYPAYLPAMENMFRVGARVVSELVDHWDRWKNSVPGF